MINAKYCYNCGSKINNNYRFCANCGANLYCFNYEAFQQETLKKEHENYSIKTIDNYMDDREFRNYIYALLPGLGFNSAKIVDIRLEDDIKTNDNDILAKMNDFTYLISTYLNTEITFEVLDECFKDVESNHATFGMIITNTKVSDEIQKKAKELNIEIIGRDRLIHII